MSEKQGHEFQGNYTDNVRVKISEKYKPPHRINLAMTYTHRLNLNKQIENNLPDYNFMLETNILKMLADWKSSRENKMEEHLARLELAKKEFERKNIEKEEQKLKEEMEIKSVNENVALSTSLAYNTSSKSVHNSGTNQNYNQSYKTEHNILMPTQAPINSCSSILKPIPLSNCTSSEYVGKLVDKSPFNISDFEDDTSSPFDNMELKSINDMEELALVLKSDDSSFKSNMQAFSNYPNIPNTSNLQNYSNYMTNQYSYNIPTTTMPYMSQTTPNSYSQTNGYYYSTDANPNRSYQQYMYPKPIPNDVRQTDNYSFQKENKTSCKSVPDIMKALQAELDNTHIDNKSLERPTKIETTRPKSTDPIYPKGKEKKAEDEDTFRLLPKGEQELCESISSMGFPIQRVVKTCKLLGGDQKKIVEHLLALADLLDLGFSEKDATSALVQCNNDRDKALDMLIS